MNSDARVNNEIFRQDQTIILAMNRILATLLPVRLVYDVAGYLAGTVLGRVTATGQYAAYASGNSDGSEAAACILFENVAPEQFLAPSGTALARGIFGGEVFTDKLVGYDAGAKSDLQAREIIDASGVSITKF